MDPIFTGRASSKLTKADQTAIVTACNEQERKTYIHGLEVETSKGIAICNATAKNESWTIDVPQITASGSEVPAPNMADHAADTNYTKWLKADLVAELDHRGIDHSEATNNTKRAQLLTESDQA